MVDVIVVGGGLAGLVSSILLSRSGLSVTLIEKNQYPFHRVCGEYISNEVIPFLEKHDLFPAEFEPAAIDELELSATNGSSFYEKLNLGGFGISRYSFDYWLSQKAKEARVTLMENTTVDSLAFKEELFSVVLKSGETLQSKIVIGAHGKRSKLDRSLNRSFILHKSPYVAVKHHIKADLPHNRISLHNFRGGYCGVSMVENERLNLCYLAHRDAFKKHGNVDKFEKEVLCKNPQLKSVFDHAEFLFDKPLVINEINFDKQEPVHNHILMCGDSAGMITPLCGNGMAMAIHSAKILSELIIESLQNETFDRAALEQKYATAWHSQFATRLWSGRKIQKLFGTGSGSAMGVFLGKAIKPVSRFLISKTHGQPFS
ncbi:MAG: NAD(P)/FAD-dependent oxidoreductase [Cyclobacteriaceae bacterium]